MNWRGFKFHVVVQCLSIISEKASIVKEQIANLDAAFKVFISQHKAGLPDRQSDDRHDMRDAINTSIDAITKLQEALKTIGKTEY